MGNQSGSESEYGGILIKADKPLYFAGDVITGNIYLNIIKEGYNGSVVQFTVVGKEVTRFHTGSGKHRHTHFGKNKFHTQTIVIHQFQDQNLHIGQYVFPFQLHMPPNFPGSYLYQKLSSAHLTYKIKAKVISKNPAILDIKNKQEIIMREPIKEIIHMEMHSDSAEVTTWGCVKQGVYNMSIKISTVKCQIDKSHYFPGETIKIEFDVDNSNCKLNIEKLDVIISRDLILSNGYTSKKIESYINKIILDGVGSGKQIAPIQKRTCQLVLQNIEDPMSEVLPSTRGNLIKSLYFVKIWPHYAGCTCCCPSFPYVAVPFTVLAVIPPGYVHEQPQKPDNWNPQEFKPQIIQYDNQVNPFGQPNQNLQQMANPMNF